MAYTSDEGYVMEPWVLDTNFDPVAIIDSYISFIWTDRYNEAGDFELYAPFSSEYLSVLKRNRYLYLDDSEHLMIIEDISLETDDDEGPRMKVTGRSIESILDRRVIWGDTILSGTLEDGIHTLLTNNVISPRIASRKIDNFIWKDPESDMSSFSLDCQYYGDTLYDVIVTLCQEYDIGWKLTLNKLNQFVFQLYSGTDRTYDQDNTTPVIFSQEFDNLQSSEYYESLRTYKNAAMVAGPHPKKEEGYYNEDDGRFYATKNEDGSYADPYNGVDGPVYVDTDTGKAYKYDGSEFYWISDSYDENANSNRLIADTTIDSSSGINRREVYVLADDVETTGTYTQPVYKTTVYIQACELNWTDIKESDCAGYVTTQSVYQDPDTLKETMVNKYYSDKECTQEITPELYTMYYCVDENKTADGQISEVGTAKVYVTAKKTTKEDTGEYESTTYDLSNEQIKKSLLEIGKQEIAENSVTVTFEADVDCLHIFKYGLDFFVGDKICIQNEYGIDTDARITEVIRTFDESGYSVTPTFSNIES